MDSLYIHALLHGVYQLFILYCLKQTKRYFNQLYSID